MKTIFMKILRLPDLVRFLLLLGEGEWHAGRSLASRLSPSGLLGGASFSSVP